MAGPSEQRLCERVGGASWAFIPASKDSGQYQQESHFGKGRETAHLFSLQLLFGKILCSV